MVVRRPRLPAMLTTAVAALTVSVVLSTCSKSPTGPSGTTPTNPTIPGPTVPGTTVPVPNPGPVTFSGAGDIAICANGAQKAGNQEATARLLEGLGGDVFTLGDNAYPNGSRADYNNCYAKSWGRLFGRTHPAPGNHEYNLLSGASGYFEYFGDLAGPSSLGYYSFNLGAWHIVSLNSNAREQGSNVSVSPGSPQAMWLQQDLAANRTRCTLAYWHHPLFSSGQNGDNPEMRTFFQILYDANADLVVTGHDHLYERFAPQAPDGRLDQQRGLRQFIVGTGGMIELYNFTAVKPNSEVRDNQHHGVLKLTLAADSYAWEFLTPNGVMDTGVPTACH